MSQTTDAVIAELMDRRLLNDVDSDLHQEIAEAVIKAAQPKVKAEGGRSEPVAWLRTWPDGAFSFSQTEPALTKWTTVLPLYTRPASPPDVEAIRCAIRDAAMSLPPSDFGSHRAIEAATTAIAALIAGER